MKEYFANIDNIDKSYVSKDIRDLLETKEKVEDIFNFYSNIKINSREFKCNIEKFSRKKDIISFTICNKTDFLDFVLKNSFLSCEIFVRDKKIIEFVNRKYNFSIKKIENTYYITFNLLEGDKHV